MRTIERLKARAWSLIIEKRCGSDLNAVMIRK
jgi:hypothetical protein